MPTKRIVCLANSYKHGGRCVAGIEVDDAGVAHWIRPVSSRPKEEVALSELRYANRQEPELLHVIEVPVVRAKPHGYQTENWLLDPSAKWKQVGKATWSDLPAMADSPKALWASGWGTTHGVNDHMPLATAKKFNRSLFLVAVDLMQVDVFSVATNSGGTVPKVRGAFEYNGTKYNLVVTDPVAKSHYMGKGKGTYSLSNCFLTISLGEDLGGDCYKLIAGVLTEKRASK